MKKAGRFANRSALALKHEAPFPWVKWATEPKRIEHMNRDDLIKEMRVQAGSWQALIIVYAVIVGTMVLSAMAIV